jgi:hypothetical protein
MQRSVVLALRTSNAHIQSSLITTGVSSIRTTVCKKAQAPENRFHYTIHSPVPREKTHYSAPYPHFGLDVPISNAVRMALQLAEGTARMHGNSPLTAGASVKAATYTNSLSHMPYRIQISQSPANRLVPARTGSTLTRNRFPTLHTSMQSCIPSIHPTPLTITSSHKYHESRPITIV